MKLFRIGVILFLKFNGTWSYFGKLNKPKQYHSSIYWNEAVYIGGKGDILDNLRTKTEIWKIADSPGEFKTTENWPELYGWKNPHLFIVPDSFFPDYLFRDFLTVNKI